jgi:hypothetical protein
VRIEIWLTRKAKIKRQPLLLQNLIPKMLREVPLEALVVVVMTRKDLVVVEIVVEIVVETVVVVEVVVEVAEVKPRKTPGPQ